MSTGLVLALTVAALLVLIVIGTPMPMAFGACIVFLILSLGVPVASMIGTGYTQTSSYVLLAMPLFVIGGALMSNSRIGSSIVDWFECLLGRIKACLIPVASATFALFGAVSGSGMAVLSCLTPILFPRMKEKGYPPETVAALLCCAGPLGLLIPPSCSQIIYAWSANVSVLSCFLAIVTPGITLTLLLAIVAQRIALKKNPALKTATEKIPAGEYMTKLGRTTYKSIPGLLMPIIILGGIYSGIMTTTESAAVAAIYAMIVAIFIYRELKFKPFVRLMANAGTTTGVIMLNIFFVMIFSRTLLDANVKGIIVNLLSSVSTNKQVILLICNLIMIVLGMLMDDGCATILVASILVPAIVELGISPYHFAAIVGVNLGMGNITPPAAPFLYMASRITGVPVKNMLKDTLLLLLFAYLPVLVITTFIPDFSLWLPKLVLGAKAIIY